MAAYVYTARDSSGNAATGTLVADSITHAQQLLRAQGNYPTTIRLASDAESDAVSTSAMADEQADIKIPRADVIQIAHQLSIMIETGVTLTEALDCIGSQCEKPNVKRLIEDLSRNVQEGRDFSSSLSRHPRSFPRLFISLIRASEKSGMLSKLLNRAVAYMRDEQETIRKVQGALTYPGIMLAFALSTTVFLLAFVLPKFTVIYASKKAALPVPTKILMNISDFIVGHWMGLIIGIVATIVITWFYVSTEGGARVWHYIQLRIPLMGKMFRKLHLARGLRMIGTMSGAGITLVDCVNTARDLTGNQYYRDLWTVVSDQIQGGKQLSEPLFQSQLVPRSVTQMLHSGEKSGKLGFVMEQVSTYAESELKEQIADLTRYIEPAMIIIMGFIIGGVALALLLPIFTISRVMSQ
ncbi:MAG: pilC [Phycisphaerales bacterium]|jgi:type IV pilus assembly protein PilC|nr:pilC [Phycisphaerales bacterium]